MLPKRVEQKIIETEEESFLPQWGIAVIVIAMASLLFVVIFGVTVVSIFKDMAQTTIQFYVLQSLS